MHGVRMSIVADVDETDDGDDETVLPGGSSDKPLAFFFVPDSSFISFM